MLLVYRLQLTVMKLCLWYTVVQGKKRDPPVPRCSQTPQENVGVVHPEHRGEPSSQARLKELKHQEYQTVLEFMQSKSKYRQFGKTLG